MPHPQFSGVPTGAGKCGWNVPSLLWELHCLQCTHSSVLMCTGDMDGTSATFCEHMIGQRKGCSRLWGRSCLHAIVLQEALWGCGTKTRSSRGLPGLKYCSNMHSCTQALEEAGPWAFLSPALALTLSPGTFLFQNRHLICSVATTFCIAERALKYVLPMPAAIAPASSEGALSIGLVGSAPSFSILLAGTFLLM